MPVKTDANSVLALNPDEGTIKWHYQFTAHDVCEEGMAYWDGAVVVFALSDR